METLRRKQESAVKSVRIREGKDSEARKGNLTGGGPRWFGYTRVYANPDEPNRRRRVVLREELNPVEAEALRDAAARVLDGETCCPMKPELPAMIRLAVSMIPRRA